MKGKAEKIEKIFNAKRISPEIAPFAASDPQVALICVVENPNFEAAAFCYSFDEFQRFSHVSDTRRKTWLVVDDRETIEKVTGYTPAVSLEDRIDEIRAQRAARQGP